MLLASCADNWDRVYEGGNPQKEGYEYLSDYAPLREYVDRSKNPNFKLALALAASDYNKQELVYALANSNFDELVTGNAMKMASCVDDKGNMNFGTVTEFVSNATSAGKEVYGHTLAWHSQQPIKWLSSLIKDKEIVVDPNEKVEKIDYELDCSSLTGYSWSGSPESVVTEWNKDGAMVITNPAPIDPWYVLQYWLVNGISLEVGKPYKISILCKAEGETEPTVRFKIGDWGDGDTRNFNIPVGGDYDVVEFNVTPKMENNGLFFQHGDFAGKIYWKSIKISHAEALAVEIPSYLYENDFEGDDLPDGWGNNSTREIVEMDGGKVLKVSNPSATDFWSAQMAVDFQKEFEKGTTYYMHMKIKGSANGVWRSGFQVTSNYSSAGDFPNISFTTDWTEHTLKVTCNADGSTRFIHSFGDFAGDIYIDDLQLYTMISANSNPLTPQEKKDTLSWAMDKWIGGMMEACGGNVKAWDVVNEAISGGNPDGEGVYALQHSDGYTAGGTWDVGGDAFYWQDYLGDLDYVRTAVASARKHFEANGGAPSDLKLFVNDYNLESDWDNNGKLKSLIAWIKRWEADGVTKIDGIGTQMHISCYMNPQTQESKKKHITQMFELMAASGKLCRVSELDMGLVDANGNPVKTADVTEEQHKAMAELYKFVVSEYLRIIPADQQWGICQWCATDSPAGSGWRGGEPVGLWDGNYYRKHTYAGFADGLQGK